MTAPPVSALLLDLDGTLVDSEPLHREGFAAWYRSRGWEYTEDVAAIFVGRRADDVFATVDGPWRGLDPQELLAEAVAAMPGDRVPEPVPGAAELFAHVAELGLPTALVTSANLAWAEKVLASLGGLEPFQVLVTRDDVTDGKPHPEGYATACRLLGVEPARALACEDAPNGVRAALAAGVGTVVGITTSFSSADLEGVGAHRTLPDLTALPALLTG